MFVSRFVYPLKISVPVLDKNLYSINKIAMKVPEQSATFSVSEGRKNETYGRSLKEKHGMTG